MNITAKEVKSLLDSKEDFILLDVRTPMEFSKGKIENAINVPIDTVNESKLAEIVPNKDSKVVVYCLSASRSSMVVEQMEKMGYTHVFNMEYGLMAWRVGKYPVV